MTRPFKVLGIQQIAIGGPSKEKLRTLWVDMFGLEVTSTFVSERENVAVPAIRSSPSCLWGQLTHRVAFCNRIDSDESMGVRGRLPCRCHIIVIGAKPNCHHSAMMSHQL